MHLVLFQFGRMGDQIEATVVQLGSNVISDPDGLVLLDCINLRGSDWLRKQQRGGQEIADCLTLYLWDGRVRPVHEVWYLLLLYCSFLFYDSNKSETGLAASVLIQDPNIQTVKSKQQRQQQQQQQQQLQTASSNEIIQNVYIFSGLTPSSKRQNDIQTMYGLSVECLGCLVFHWQIISG